MIDSLRIFFQREANTCGPKDDLLGVGAHDLPVFVGRLDGAAQPAVLRRQELAIRRCGSARPEKRDRSPPTEADDIVDCYADEMATDQTRVILTELKLLLRPAGGGLYLVSTGKAEQQALQRRVYRVDNDTDVQAAFEKNLERIVEARVVILGIPSDTGAGFRRGANLGPQALRETWLAHDPELPARFAHDGVVDIGDVFVVPQLLDDDMLGEAQLKSTRRALYPDVSDDVRDRLPVSALSIAERVWSLVFALNPMAKPLTLGGDHSTAWPAVKAMHDAGRRFCILQFDAHTDLLAERLGVRMCFATWSFHANELIGRQRRLVQVGVRASRFPRAHWEGQLDVAQYWAADVNADTAAAVDEIIATLKASGLPVLISNDIDGTDARWASAAGTPELEGLHPDVVNEIITRAGREFDVVGADLMEVAPLLEVEEAGTTLHTALRYLEATLQALLRAP